MSQETFQQRVQPWMTACFGEKISGDKLERGDRLAEEVFELLQSGGYPRERLAALTDYVYGRPVGEPHQEVGGVMVTLAAYCLAHDLEMHQAGEDELGRVWTKIEKIRAKQAAKPTGSALPIPKKVEERIYRWPKRGDKMHFLNRNGYDGERTRAAEIFDTNQSYTVKSISIGSWSSLIYFEEVDGGWNSVMFDFAEENEGDTQ
jgi:hypothetical protein